ncbi:glycosyltransferase family 2 protein [Phocaeicola plebeius]|uniref:glycosyltransferase family 2 protein n=1 Tax=Phocaeicola plebeius TaxID=310297 RepID=UPI0026F0F451|nr:glycosyltransferase family 2 protein [Phocaeicola plebeius]
MIPNNPEISVIVPIYNAEKYIERCIQSILNQTFKKFELILIDDGSPDKCGEICNAYGKQDSRIKVIHKENGGPSDSRNTGIKHATGKWIVFIDSDDYISPYYLEHLFNANQQQDEYLLIIQDNRYVDLEGNEIPHPRCYYNNELIQIGKNQELVIKYRILHHYAIYGKLFSNKIIKEKRLKFNYKIKICEDGLFINQYMLYMDRIFLSSERDYYYIMPQEGKYSISTAIKQSNEALHELAKIYSTLSISLIKKFKIENYSYAHEVMNVFMNRYLYCIEHNIAKDIICPTLKYYHPTSWLEKIYKNIFQYFPNSWYRNLLIIYNRIKKH